MGYSTPLGGASRLLAPGLVIYSCPFIRAGKIYFGARASFITLSSSTDKETNLLIYAPVPWGAECQRVIDEIAQRDQTKVNVKYIVAPDVEHYMGVAGWKAQYNSAAIIAVEGIAAKLLQAGPNGQPIKVDYEFQEAKGYPILPEELLQGLKWRYVPDHRNKELALFHEASKSLIVADLLFNGPAFEQYKGTGISPTGGVFSKIMNYMYPDSRVQRVAVSQIMPVAKASEDIKAIMQWPFDRTVVCHGDVIETGAKEKLSKLFTAYIEHTTS